MSQRQNIVTDEIMDLFHQHVPSNITARLLTRNGVTQIMPEDECRKIERILELKSQIFDLMDECGRLEATRL